MYMCVVSETLASETKEAKRARFGQEGRENRGYGRKMSKGERGSGRETTRAREGMYRESRTMTTDQSTLGRPLPSVRARYLL